MADEQNEGKSSDRTKVILAVIGLMGTVATGAFTYMATQRNDQQPTSAPAPTANPGDASPIPQSQPAPAPDPMIPETTTPAPAINIVGEWYAPDGTGGVTFQQNGTNLQVGVIVMANMQPVALTGTGTIRARKVSWVVSTINGVGPQFEYECIGRLSSNHSTIQGTCNGYGGQAPLYVTRAN